MQICWVGDVDDAIFGSFLVIFEAFWNSVFSFSHFPIIQNNFKQIAWAFFDKRYNKLKLKALSKLLQINFRYLATAIKVNSGGNSEKIDCDELGHLYDIEPLSDIT